MCMSKIKPTAICSFLLQILKIQITKWINNVKVKAALHIFRESTVDESRGIYLAEIYYFILPKVWREKTSPLKYSI